MIKTITLNGEVTKIDFDPDGKNPYFYTSEKNAWIKNKGTSAVYVSVSSDCSAATDGTAEIGSGESVRLRLDRTNCIYASGSGEIEVHTGEICPFKTNAKGGGNNGLILTTDNLAFALSTEFTDFRNYASLPKVSLFGIATGIAERSVEIVNKCGTADNFILSYGNDSTYGSAFALTQTAFVGYYNSVVYIDSFENVPKTTRYICCTNYGKDIKIYVNGEKIVDTQLDYSCNPNDSELLLNYWRSSSNGMIKSDNCTTYEIRIFNKILNESEIKNNYAVYKERYNIQ